MTTEPWLPTLILVYTICLQIYKNACKDKLWYELCFMSLEQMIDQNLKEQTAFTIAYDKAV